MTALSRDCRLGLRLLARSPGLAATVVFTLALGIGASTAVWTAIDSVLLARLPYPDADRLVFISRAYPGFPQGGGNFSYPAVLDIARGNRTLDAFAAYQAYGAMALTEGPEPVRVTVNWTAPAYLELLGLKPRLGRIFRPEEDWYEGAEPVVVLADAFWRRQFGAASDVLGRKIRMNGSPYLVIGIAPPGFRDAPAEQEFGEPVDVWLPLGLAHRVLGQFGPADRAGAILWGIGRRKPGATLEETHADIASIGERLARDYPDTDRGFGLVARSLKHQLVGELFAPVRILAAGAAIILLIGCGNAANLLLARLLARRREMTLRRALGATRLRLVAQILVESLVLASLGGAAGLLCALGILGALRHGAVGLPAAVALRWDARTLAVSLLLTLSTGLLVGLAGALLTSRPELREDLNSGFREIGSGRGRGAARALVIAEVALAILLMSGAGLLAKSLHNLASADLGFKTAGLLTMRIDLRDARYAEEDARARFGRELVESLAASPGVDSTTLWGPSMLGRATWVVETAPEGAPRDDPKDTIMSWRHSVNPGALANLGIPILRGRDFTWSDDARAPRVAIVSESTARAMWPGADPVGRRFSSIRHGIGFTVIGVTRDARHRQRLDLLDAAMGIPPSGLGPQRDIYFPYLQRPNAALVVAVRTSDPAIAAQSLRAAVRRKDPALTVYDMALLEERLLRQDRGSRVLTSLAAAYAAVALALAAIGLYGVLTHSVEQRTREIGIRRALGAGRSSVLWRVLRDGLAMTLVGCAVGLAGALFATRVLVTLLFGVTPVDPAVLGSISLFLLVVAAAASWLPARRATRVDPSVALRGD